MKYCIIMSGRNRLKLNNNDLNFVDFCYHFINFREQNTVTRKQFSVVSKLSNIRSSVQ